MLIAENELLGAAESIEKAATKLANLIPRKKVKGKVRFLNFIMVIYRIVLKSAFRRY